MGLVTDTLIDMIRAQVDAHRTVVWFDPERAYEHVAQALTLPETAVYGYDARRGFAALRRELEPVWSGPEQPRLVIYVPLSSADSHNALIEFIACGVVVQPGQQPPECNTRLAVVARRALAAAFPPAAVEDIVGQVERGQLDLAELDELVERGAKPGVLSIIFGMDEAEEIALRFVSDPSVDVAIVERGAALPLARLFIDALGVNFDATVGLPALRAMLARHILVTELLEHLPGPRPDSLEGWPRPAHKVARQAAVQLARAWRNQRDLAESYVRWANQVQSELGLGPLAMDADELTKVETFASCETQLQALVKEALCKQANKRWAELAVRRAATGFWPAQEPVLKLHWQVIADAAEVLIHAERIEKALKGRAQSAGALLSGYAFDDSPWCELDTAQRHLERDFYRVDIEPGQYASLVELVTLARQRYAVVADALAEKFTRAYAADKFELPGVMLQVDVYREAVLPAVEAGRVAYILVDALRFEMARELCAQIGDEWTHTLTPALATVPAITEVGMAALMPGAEKGVTLVTAGPGKLALVVGGETLRDRQDRIKRIQKFGPQPVVSAKLGQLAPLTDAHLRSSLQAARLVVVTASDEIDGLCEAMPDQARRLLDDVFEQLRRAIKTLLGAGVQTVIITADHGYLFGDKLEPWQAIDPPGGQTADLHRRVWVGIGGAALPGCLRTPLSAFGISGNLELVTPWNLACFKAPGGAMAYFHGGLSLQEIVIPVLTIKPGKAAAPGLVAAIKWKLTPGSPQIATRFFSVTIEGQAAELLPITPPVVHVEVRAGDKAISMPVSAGYGFQETTKDVKLDLEAENPQVIARNTVTLQITDTPDVTHVSVHLLDAATGARLAHIARIPFAIAI